MRKEYYKTTDGSIIEWRGLTPAANWVKLQVKEGEKLYRQQCFESLKRIMSGDTVYTVVRSASSSGMSREISAYVVSDGKIVCIDWYIVRILGWKQGKAGVKVSGCGMDMGFHLVSTLSRAMYGDDYKLSQAWL